MLEFRNQMMQGIFLHPYAFSSSLAHGSGIIFSNMWLTALFYGTPAALISPERMDIVLLGRSITAIFAFTLLIALYEIVRKLTSDRLLALFSVFLLLTSRTFFFTSHSARYDILSALAILTGVYILLRIRRPVAMLHAAIIGCIVAATSLVTIHVTLALALAAIVVVLYHAGKRCPSALAAFVVGVGFFIFVVFTVSAIRGESTLFGTSGTTSFALNVHDIPALRLFSRSVQFANLAQRWSMFRMYGFGYILIFVGIAIIALFQYLRKRGRIPIPLSTMIVVAVLLSWIELESAAPSSYLIYVLPVLSVAVGLALQCIVREQFRIWVIVAANIILGILAFHDMRMTHGKGSTLMSANAYAIGAALGTIEEKDSGIRPLVLAFNPAVHEVLRDTNVRLMTTQFIEYPLTTASVDSILRKEGVNYVLVYTSTIRPDYMREVGPIRAALARIATPVWERSGYFTDIDRSYFDTTLSEPDTLRLYRINTAK